MTGVGTQQGDDIGRGDAVVGVDAQHAVERLQHRGRQLLRHLVPSLLELFGDVEACGFFEQPRHRSMISKFLQYLLPFAGHTAAFRAVDEESFVTFANGLLNQTNARYNDALEALPVVATFERERGLPGWGDQPEAERTQREELYAEQERNVPHFLSQANEPVVVVYIMYFLGGREGEGA